MVKQAVTSTLAAKIDKNKLVRDGLSVKFAVIDFKVSFIKFVRSGLNVQF